MLVYLYVTVTMIERIFRADHSTQTVVPSVKTFLSLLQNFISFIWIIRHSHQRIYFHSNRYRFVYSEFKLNFCVKFCSSESYLKGAARRDLWQWKNCLSWRRCRFIVFKGVTIKLVGVRLISLNFVFCNPFLMVVLTLKCNVCWVWS